MRALALLFLFSFTVSQAKAERWEKPRPVRPDVLDVECGLNQVWARFKGSGREYPSEQITSDTVPKLQLLEGLLSPARDRYFYVEELPAHHKSGILDLHIDDGFTPEPNFIWEHEFPWHKNEIGLRVHVYTTSGDQVTSVDLPRSYSEEIGAGFWLGNHMICLQHRIGGRGNFYSVFVSVETGAKRLVGWQGLQPEATSDSQHVLFEHRGVLYDNFRPVYPFYGEVLPDFGTREGWAAYKQKYFVRREPYPHQRAGNHRVGGFATAPDGEKAILPDGKRAVFIDARPESPGSKTMAHRLMVIDLDQIEKTRNPQRYARVVVILPPTRDPYLHLPSKDANELSVWGDRPAREIWKMPLAGLGKK